MDGLNYPNFLPEEIDLLLNQAYQRWIKQRYGTTNIKRESFEETQKRTEDLKALLVQVNLNPTASNKENIDYNSYFVELPTDHWFIVQERAVINCTECNNTVILYTNNIGETPGSDSDTSSTESLTGVRVEVRPIQHMEIDKIISDPFKGPDNEKILRLMYKDYVELILPTGATLLKYNLRYIKQPVTVSLDDDITFETSEHTHDEIIDEAVKIALEGIEGKRTQTFTPIIDNQKE
jgi:hypothetical protein